MIFLTVGTELPFDRLVRAVDAWCAGSGRGDVYGQLGAVGTAGYRPRHFEWCEFLEPDEYDARCKACEVIIGHAGMGTIITGLTYRKRVVIMPRKASLREHRNDHQLATADRFRPRPGITVAEDETALPAILDRVLAPAEPGDGLEPIGEFANPTLIKTLQDFINKG